MEDTPFPQDETPIPPNIRSLKDLINLVTGKNEQPAASSGASGLADIRPFPLLAMVGLEELKLALLLSVINPAIGGALLIGPRGTGKTTAARGLSTLLPMVERSSCYYGCLPEDVEIGGIDAVCPDCARKYAEGNLSKIVEPMRIVELPLTSTIEDVIGSLDERALVHDRTRIKRGILSLADQNLLYVDEINLLPAQVTDAILDAAAQGTYTIRHGAISATYWSRFILVGSMNPDEGSLRPPIMDRFGLRVFAHPLEESRTRLLAYELAADYRRNPHQFVSRYEVETEAARQEIIAARKALPGVKTGNRIYKIGSEIIKELGIKSLRAEIALFEATRAYAAAAGREIPELNDLLTVAPLALRLRRGDSAHHRPADEEAEIDSAIKKYCE